jgi:hypothetical protein
MTGIGEQSIDEGLVPLGGIVSEDRRELLGLGGEAEEIEMEAERSWLGRCAAVTARPSHAHPDRSVEAADEIGDDHDAPGEDADDHQRDIAGFAANLSGQPIDTSGEIGSGKKNTHEDRHREIAGQTRPHISGFYRLRADTDKRRRPRARTTPMPQTTAIRHVTAEDGSGTANGVIR